MAEKIFKAFSAVSKAVDLDLGIFEAMISTEAVDRQGDIVRATGAKLENYLKNPVVLWAHNYGEPPVARTLSIEILPGQGLKARFQFPERGVSERADEVRALWAAGFLNATSIGFQPLSANPLGERSDFWGPQEYTEWELMEFSIVPVPANQEALRLAVKTVEAGIKTPVEKRGRVLSAGNEKKLRSAQALLEEVLSQLQAEESEPEQDGITGGESEPDTHSGKAESTVDDDIEQRNKAYAALSDLFDTMRGTK